MPRAQTLSYPFLAMLVWMAAAVPSPACPFCSENQGPTLVGDHAQASMVLFGSFTNAKPGANGFDGTTDFVIEKVVKSHDYLKGVKNKTITLPRHVPFAKNKYLVFVDVYKGNLDPYRGVEVQPKSEIVEYLEGAVKLEKGPAPQRLRYCFDFLNSADFDVAMDAYREYAKADYKEYKDMAKKLPPDVIAGWLKDPKTPAYRYGLYASLLGHCGGAEHAKLLRSMIDDPEKRKGSGIDGLLAAYVMLQPKEGWVYVQDMLKNEKHEFMFRYACLRTLRFLWDQRTDLVSQKEIVHGMSLVLGQPDMADFGIEDLRRWQRWEMTQPILNLFGQKSHNIPVVKRAVLRFALASPDPKAKDFIRQQRERDLDWVRDTEELLKLETDTQSSGPIKSGHPSK
jgi:hypothetical protein